MLFPAGFAFFPEQERKQRHLDPHPSREIHPARESVKEHRGKLLGDFIERIRDLIER